MQANNTLRFDCSITTDVASTVEVKMGKNTGAGCQDVRSVGVVGSSTTHNLTLYGMKPSTVYEWRAYATSGGLSTSTACKTETSGVLPSTNGSSQLNQLTVSTSGAADDVNNFLTHYGCYTGANERHDAFVIIDDDGDIVWYQDPSDDVYPNGYITPVIMEAVSLSRPNKHILGIINHEYIVEYDLAGNLVHMFCRDASGTGDCADAMAVPDLTWDQGVYVHHDVELSNNHIWALTARNVNVTDALDCDHDLSYVDTWPIVVDGLYGFDITGSPNQDVDWIWTDDPGITVDYSVAGACSNGNYWNGKLSGNDYMHTNAFWPDSSDQWMFSIKNFNDVWSVDGDALSMTYGLVQWQLDGDGVGGDFSFVGGGYTENFHGQHGAQWDPDGNLTLLDNEGGTANDTRGMLYDVDMGAWTVEAIEEYTMEDTTAGNLNCPTGGSSFMLLSGHSFVTCAQTGIGSPSYVNEFDISNSVVWAAELDCQSGNPNYNPVSDAFRGYQNAY